MDRDNLFERLWNGTSTMEEWTEAVSDGAITQVIDDIIAVHTTYFCGSVIASVPMTASSTLTLSSLST